MPVVRMEQVQLEVLPGPVRDVLAVDHDAQPEPPLRDLQARREALQPRAHPLPAPAPPDLVADAEPVPQRGLQGVLHARRLQEIEDFPSEEGPIQAGLEVARGQLLPDIVDEEPEQLQGPLRVVGVARAILHGEQLARLGQMGRQRIVGLVLRVVRIEAPLGSFRQQARAQHRAIEL